MHDDWQTHEFISMCLKWELLERSLPGCVHHYTFHVYFFCHAAKELEGRIEENREKLSKFPYAVNTNA